MAETTAERRETWSVSDRVTSNSYPMRGRMLRTDRARNGIDHSRKGIENSVFCHTANFLGDTRPRNDSTGLSIIPQVDMTHAWTQHHIKRVPERSRTSGRDSAFVMAAALFAPLITSAPARAALSVMPVVHEILLDSSETSTGRWSVRNLSDRPLSVSLHVIDYADYTRGRRNAPAPAWLSVSPASLYLEPGAESSVSYSAVLPESLSGESMAFVFFQEDGGGMIQGRIGTAFYVMSRGTLSPLIAMTAFRLVDDGRNGKRFFIEIANRGNVHLRPSGSIVILDSSGQTAASARLNVGMPILPAARERFVTESLNTLPPPGDYRARWSLSTEPVDGAPGPVLEGECDLRFE